MPKSRARGIVGGRLETDVQVHRCLKSGITRPRSAVTLEPIPLAWLEDLSYNLEGLPLVGRYSQAER